MFQRIDQLRTGSMFIVTGLAGAGKSHLAASARKSGTVWVLDTEGASQHLVGKAGIHPHIQAVQSLSLRQLLDAMREVKRIGKAGDTVILDSISKVLQSMRSYAQQRAGGEIDRKANLSYDEHASVNRNMQSIYTGLTELKHAGFHVLIIGHLVKKYQTNGSALKDDGLRVLADENINYEADAILLVERKGAKRMVTPIIKPPRQRHLQLNQEYSATIAALFPDQALDDGKGAASVAAPEAPANVSQFPSAEARASSAPKTPREAKERFYARYGASIGGNNWEAVEVFLGGPREEPKTIEDWYTIAGEVRDLLNPPDQVAAS